MRFLGSTFTTLLILGYFTLNSVSSPFPWNHPSWSGGPPPGSPVAASRVAASPAPVTSTPPSTTSTTSTSSTSDDTDDTTTTTTNTGSDSSSGGSGTPGQALIVNKCSFTTYVYVCKQHPATCGDTSPMTANGGTYSEAYAPASDGGHSLKISITKGSGNILQFEYTNEGNGEVSYDLSEVNGNPFGQYGFSLTNTTTDAYCAPPATSCPAIFTVPTNGIPYTAPTSDGIGAILCG